MAKMKRTSQFNDQHGGSGSGSLGDDLSDDPHGKRFRAPQGGYPTAGLSTEEQLGWLQRLQQQQELPDSSLTAPFAAPQDRAAATTTTTTTTTTAHHAVSSLETPSFGARNASPARESAQAQFAFHHEDPAFNPQQDYHHLQQAAPQQQQQQLQAMQQRQQFQQLQQPQQQHFQPQQQAQRFHSNQQQPQHHQREQQSSMMADLLQRYQESSAGAVGPSAAMGFNNQSASSFQSRDLSYPNSMQMPHLSTSDTLMDDRIYHDSFRSESQYLPHAPTSNMGSDAAFRRAALFEAQQQQQQQQHRQAQLPHESFFGNSGNLMGAASTAQSSTHPSQLSNHSNWFNQNNASGGGASSGMDPANATGIPTNYPVILGASSFAPASRPDFAAASTGLPLFDSTLASTATGRSQQPGMLQGSDSMGPVSSGASRYLQAKEGLLMYGQQPHPVIATNTAPLIMDRAHSLGGSGGSMYMDSSSNSASARGLLSSPKKVTSQRSAMTALTARSAVEVSYDPGKVKELSLPSDKGNLSEYQCLLRQQIILFAVTNNDIQCSAQGRNRPITLGQVGVLCRHCARIPPGMRPSGAVYFPAKLSGLYQASQNMAINHFSKSCQSIPEATRSRLFKLKERKSTVLGGGKHFWANGARVIGVVEHDLQLRFKEDDAASEGGGDQSTTVGINAQVSATV